MATYEANVTATSEGYVDTQVVIHLGASVTPQMDPRFKLAHVFRPLQASVFSIKVVANSPRNFPNLPIIK